MNNEWIGIAGTLIILIAFLMNGERKIRTLDLIGAVLFVIYGFAISSLSTVALNGSLIIIQLYKLYKLR